MKLKSVQFIALALVLSCVGSAQISAAESMGLNADINSAIKRSVPYLQREGLAWIEERKCVSCHQVPFMLWGLHAAQAAGFEVDDESLQERSDWSLTWQSWQNPKNAKESDEASTAQGNVDTMYFVLLGRQGYAAQDRNPEATANLHNLILANQQADGSFKPGGQLPLQRRPLAETTQISTMWALLALPPVETDQPREVARQKALTFLASDLSAISTEWFVTRYLLHLQTGEVEQASAILKALLAAQNEDGGWGWLLEEESDAFGTGAALYALGHADGIAYRDAIERAKNFLVTTQGDDGAWQVPGTKKTSKGKPRPTSTYWGTAWAVIGLCETK